MNRAEIQHKIEQANNDAFAIRENILKLQEQLAEIEISKIRHGDFGITNYPKPRVNFPMLAFLPNLKSGTPLRITHIDGSGGYSEGNENILWLGNIFDLLNSIEFDVNKYEIDSFTTTYKKRKRGVS